MGSALRPMAHVLMGWLSPPSLVQLDRWTQGPGGGLHLLLPPGAPPQLGPPLLPPPGLLQQHGPLLLLQKSQRMRDVGRSGFLGFQIRRLIPLFALFLDTTPRNLLWRVLSILITLSPSAAK